MNWQLDPTHSEIGFAVKHLMIATVRGKFGAVDGTFALEPASPEEAQAVLSIDVASIDTGQTQRDAHLRSADFFDAERYPKITFRSTKVRALGGDAYELLGDLTIRDITKPVHLSAELAGPLKDPWGNRRLGLSASGEIDREDWGLVWNQLLESGGVAVAKKVKLSVELELTAKD